jgi:hypothetical protein
MKIRVFFGILATTLQPSPMELRINFVTRGRIYRRENEPKHVRIYISFYMTRYLSKCLPLPAVMDTLMPL